MIMQVHDELVFEVRADRAEAIAAGVRERMAAAAELAVPLVVDVGVGANWDEAH
jgi:DNA polymerase-1